VYIDADLVEDEVESMKRYLEPIQDDDLRKIKANNNNNTIS
jgi:hypothetical protein